MDLVCQPLSINSQLVSSGSIIDAFAASKPLLLVANQMHHPIRDKYGEFGILFSDKAALRGLFTKADPARINGNYQNWAKTIARICDARESVALAQAYSVII